MIDVVPWIVAHATEAPLFATQGEIVETFFRGTQRTLRRSAAFDALEGWANSAGSRRRLIHSILENLIDGL